MRPGVKRTNLFLLELVFNLMIFALCAGVCVGLLIHAKSLSRDSGDLTFAVYAAQTAAEEWRCGAVSGGDWCPGARFPDGESAAGKLFRADGAAFSAEEAAGLTQPGDAAYALTLTPLPADAGLRSVRISVTRGYPGTEIYTLTASAPGEVSLP